MNPSELRDSSTTIRQRAAKGGTVTTHTRHVHSRLRSCVCRLTTLIAIVLGVSSVFAYVAYERDGLELQQVCERVVADHPRPTDRILALLHFVHALRPTRENFDAFLIPRLRATPMQVLRGGGDCADKSRLLSALLTHAGVQAGPVMCFDPKTQRPTHTVVCAYLPSGKTMVVDPAYELFFPDVSTQRYFGLSDLRRDPSILTSRLEDMRTTLPSSHPAHYYNAGASPYTLASSINWNKNSMTQFAQGVLYSLFGETLYAWPRPRFIEEPQLFVCMAVGTGAVCMVMLRLCIGRRRYTHVGRAAPLGIECQNAGDIAHDFAKGATAGI